MYAIGDKRNSKSIFVEVSHVSPDYDQHVSFAKILDLKVQLRKLVDFDKSSRHYYLDQSIDVLHGLKNLCNFVHQSSKSLIRLI